MKPLQELERVIEQESVGSDSEKSRFSNLGVLRAVTIQRHIQICRHTVVPVHAGETIKFGLSMNILKDTDSSKDDLTK